MKKTLLLSLMALATLSYADKPAVQKTQHTCTKPGAPLQIVYNAPHVAADETVEVEFGFQSSQKSALAELTITVDSGLDVVDGIVGRSTARIEDGKSVVPYRLKVRSSADGLYYIKIVASLGKMGTRAFAIPVYIGKATPKLKRGKTTESSEGRLSIQQAVETIVR